MWTLKRQVRFNLQPSGPTQIAGTNGFAGIPAMHGLGYYLALDVIVGGEPIPKSQYVVDIRDVDHAMRDIALPLIQKHLFANPPVEPAHLLPVLCDHVSTAMAPARLLGLSLHCTPFQTLTCWEQERPMIRLSQKFEFSAAHRLHNPALTPEQNSSLYGKCNNPHGHGHNYELEVTLAGIPDATGTLLPIDQFEQIVQQQVIDYLDHRHLNQEIPEFQQKIPSVENIAQVIYHRLESALKHANSHLAAVTVWETPKTSATYSPFPQPLG